MVSLRYPVIVSPLSDEDGGGFLATVPDLPGCMSDGETPAEAIENVRDAIEE
jgi:antitoxin HicB